MKIVLLGRLADAAGGREQSLDLPSEITDVEALRDWLGEEIPALLDPTVRVIVNNVLAQGGQAIAADNEVAFFPLVSGG